MLEPVYKTLYVDSNASEGGDGESRFTAVRTIEEAFARAGRNDHIIIKGPGALEGCVELPPEVKSTEYTVLIHWQLDILIDFVNVKLEEGWQCQGGVSTSINEEDGVIFHSYMQAMVLVKEADAA